MLQEKKNNSLLSTILLGALFGSLVFGIKWYYQTQTMDDLVETTGLYENVGGDFSLTHVSGPYNLSMLMGKPSVLYFGFASCPDVCPLSLNKLNKALDAIDPSIHAKINKVFISVDYKRDTPKIVDDYGKYFASDFIGLTGTKEEIESITKKYSVHFEFVPMPESEIGYTVDHTSRFFLLNQKGQVVNTFSDIINDQKFKEQLLGLLK